MDRACEERCQPELMAVMPRVCDVSCTRHAGYYNCGSKQIAKTCFGAYKGVYAGYECVVPGLTCAPTVRAAQMSSTKRTLCDHCGSC